VPDLHGLPPPLTGLRGSIAQTRAGPAGMRRTVPALRPQAALTGFRAADRFAAIRYRPKTDGPTRDGRRKVVCYLLPGSDPDAAALLGPARLRAAAALRHGGRRRHLSLGDHAARARQQALERGLCPAVAASDR